MAQVFSSKMLTAMLKDEDGELLLAFLKIDHADLGAPLYFVNDSEGETSGGQAYVAYPFDIVVGADERGRAPEGRLVIAAVDGQVTAALRGLIGKPSVEVFFAFKSSPNTVEASGFEFELDLADIDSERGTISGRLSYPNIYSEPYPAASYGTPNFPGLFASV